MDNNSALIIVDLQNDFISGSLSVKNYGDLTQRINNFQKNFKHVIYTKDNHPTDHISFINDNTIENKNVETDLEIELNTIQNNHSINVDLITKMFFRKFPIHCVKNTYGNEFDKDLIIKEDSLIVNKGESRYKEEFSGFSNPELNSYLMKNEIKNVYVCGLVYEFCVSSTCIDSAILGYNTYLVKDLTISLNNEENDEHNSFNVENSEYNLKNANNKELLLVNSLGNISNTRNLLQFLKISEIQSNNVYINNVSL